jgi:hypothetical protein
MLDITSFSVSTVVWFIVSRYEMLWSIILIHFVMYGVQVSILFDIEVHAMCSWASSCQIIQWDCSSTLKYLNFSSGRVWLSFHQVGTAEGTNRRTAESTLQINLTQTTEEAIKAVRAYPRIYLSQNWVNSCVFCCMNWHCLVSNTEQHYQIKSNFAVRSSLNYKIFAVSGIALLQFVH